MSSTAGTTKFTRRNGTYVFPKPTQTNGYLSIVLAWHRKMHRQEDIVFRPEKSGPQHNLEWKVVPTILGEENPQFTGYGSTINEAKADSAKKIHDSGHCGGSVASIHVYGFISVTFVFIIYHTVSIDNMISTPSVL
ncbi:hypothetical protein RhiJN_25276 [Ceratobasidium sp. AG-Ba]|nr:hypothetical protein RhiJN_25276 [Ceratobasidium sp. AG-Ba]